jgi:hypothetical protein
MFENWTRKLSGLVLVCVLGVWCVAGWVLATRVDPATARIYLADPVLLGSYFGTVLAVILPVVLTGSKSSIEKAIAQRTASGK